MENLQSSVEETNESNCYDSNQIKISNFLSPKIAVNQWIKGVGCYLLIFMFCSNILENNLLKKVSFISHKGFETIQYYTLIISLLYLPIVIGNAIDFGSVTIIKIIRNWEVKNSDRKLEILVAWIISITFNTAAIQRIAMQNVKSFDFYLKQNLLKRVFETNIANANSIEIILVSSIFLACFFAICLLFESNQLLKKIFDERIVLLFIVIILSVAWWGMVFGINSLYHLNVVLFPVVNNLTNSPSTPIVSDGFISLYGGYFFLLSLLIKPLGVNLLSVQTILLACVILQIILCFTIIRCLIKQPLIRIGVFLNCIFWSYAWGRYVSKDIYFQYFPLRLIFPSFFILVAYSLYSNQRFNKNILSTKLINLKLKHIVFSAIVALSIFNNLDSGLSTFAIYLALLAWDCFKLKKLKLGQYLITTIVNIGLIIILFFVMFRTMLGDYPNLKLYTTSTVKFASGFFSLPFRDNLWMLFVLFYVYTLIQSFNSSVEDVNGRFRFSTAIWGLISMAYFVNRSHPWNLLSVSFPFFLCCGFLMEQSLNSLLESKNNLLEKPEQLRFMGVIRLLLSNWLDLVKLSSESVFLMPFIAALIIAFIQVTGIAGLTIYQSKNPSKNVYAYMEAVRNLSEKIAVLEKEFNRPSILLSNTAESYYYLLGNRKILFYPEITSMFNSSYKSRFTKVLDEFNPIVTICPFRGHAEQELKESFKTMLEENQFKLIKAEGECKIYMKS